MDQNNPILSRPPVSPMSTVQSRRRPDTPSLTLVFPAPPLRLDPITPPRRDSDTLPPDIGPYTEPVRHPRRVSSRRSGACLRSIPLIPPVPPIPSLDVTVDSPNAMTLAQMPPTPTASIHSPSRRKSLEKLASRNSGSVSAKTKMFGGAISPRQSTPGPSARSGLPPTPPNQEETTSREVFTAPEASTSTSLAFSEPKVPPRPRRGRRPMSGYPRPESPSRQSSSSNDRLSTHQLDVDLDVYSTTEYDTEENALEDREPTLSFLTTSTIESTHGTPSSIGATYGEDGKPLAGESEPRIRMRTTTGRSTAYSSAESSMASAAYSYHAYADNNVYHPHPPPLPTIPNGLKPENVGLGFSTPDLAIPPTFADESSPSVVDPNSPAHSFAHRPWKSDVPTRMRSDSASSGSEGPDENVVSLDHESFPADGFDYDQSWEKPETHEAEAVALVEEGKSRILDRARLEALGGVEALTDEVIASLAGTTHLLLADVGSTIYEALPLLLSTVSSTLVVLDLADNGLSFLPESLRHCTLLEELNVSENPLRALPTWIAELVEMRMLVVDGCRLQHIPQDLSALGRLHTLCARRNRLVSLPSWLCLLGQLETLRVDGNPFAPEWMSIVSPILATPPTSAPFPPTASQASANRSRSSSLAQSMDSRTDTESLTSPVMPAAQSMLTLDPIAEDHPHSAPPPVNDGLVDSPDRMTGSPSSPEKMSTIFESPRGLRKMRSAGDLLEPRPATTHNAVGPSKPMDSMRGIGRSGERPLGSLGAREGSRMGSTFTLSNYDESMSPSKGRPSTSSGIKSKSDKWGFLRKMSMHRLKSDKSTTAASASANLISLPPLAHHAHSDMGPNTLVTPRPPLQGARSAHTLPTRRLATAEFGSMPSTPSTIAMSAMPQTMPASLNVFGSGPKQSKRKSFLLVDGPPSLSVNIPPSSPFLNTSAMFDEIRTPGAASPSIEQLVAPEDTDRALPETPNVPVSTVASSTPGLGSPMELDADTRYSRGLESIKSYLRDLFDLSRPPVEPYGSFEVVSNENGSDGYGPNSPGSARESRSSIADARRSRRPTTDHQSSSASVVESERSASSASMASHENVENGVLTGKKFKNDASKRARVLREIWETERTYVRGLGELVTIYVKPSANAVNPSKSNETVIPSSERKVVFGGIESILSIHRDNLLPALEKAVRPLLEGTDDEAGELSTRTAHAVGEVFRTYIAYMKQYSSYINNFDNALSRMKTWTAPSSAPGTPGYPVKPGRPGTANGVAAGAVSVGMGLSSLSLPLVDAPPHSGNQMTTSQKKRVKGFLKRCREHPLHSQINLESYLLLPIQRVPRYKLLLEDLAMCTMPQTDGPRDTLDDALNEIASLASLMNEEKRDADSRLRLLHWQKRITTRGPSPLVQPHRRLVMDGALTLIRLVKKASTFVEVDNTSSSLTTRGSSNDAEQTITPSKVVVPIEYITPEPMNRPIMLILCSDLLALVQQRHGGGWEGSVDLFNVLRMGTLREPATIVHGNVLRVVDNKSIYYFNGATPEMILQWSRAINSARKR